MSLANNKLKIDNNILDQNQIYLSNPFFQKETFHIADFTKKKDFETNFYSEKITDLTKPEETFSKSLSKAATQVYFAVNKSPGNKIIPDNLSTNKVITHTKSIIFKCNHY